MDLHDALHDALVNAHDGPVYDLRRLRLPTVPEGHRQEHPVEVAFKPLSGIGSTRTLGSRLVGDTTDPSRAVKHDGGVVWWHSGALFDIRSRRTDLPPVEGEDEPELAVTTTANFVRDVLAQYRGEVDDDDVLVWCDLGAPYFARQDRRGRIVLNVRGEIWHRPERTMA